MLSFLVPTSTFYNIMIRGLLDSHQTEEAETLFTEMSNNTTTTENARGDRCSPTTGTYTALIDAYMKRNQRVGNDR